MVSSLAIADLATLRAEGLNPSDADVIRINALALRITNARRPRLNSAAPRIAFIRDVIIHEPTYQCEKWLEETAETISADDRTYEALRLYALAHAAVPGFFGRWWMRRPRLIALIVSYWFKRRLPRATPREAAAAVRHVTYGNRHTDGEHPEPNPNKKEDDADKAETLIDAWSGDIIQALGLCGVTLHDASTLTWSQLGTMLRCAYIANGLCASFADTAHGDYLVTLEAIRKRLLEEGRAKPSRQADSSGGIPAVGFECRATASRPADEQEATDG